MKRPIAISLSPNASKEDARLALHLLFVQSYWSDQKVLSRAAEKLATHFPGHFVALASSGRQALFDLLRSYGIGKGDEVILQAFTCIAVPEPILWTGATPVYADIAKESYSIDPEEVKKKITPNTKAIIVQHTFGISGPIQDILAIAKQHHIIVIEDCAHALGASYEGKKLGTFADAAILSFGRDKCISSVFGGAVITKDKSNINAIRAKQSERLAPPKSWVAQQLFHVVLLHYLLPIYFWHQTGKAFLVLAQRMHLVSRAVDYEEREGKRPAHISYSYSPALALLLLKQLEKLDRMTQRRQEIALRYRKELHGFPLPAQNADASWLRFPLRVDNAQGILLDARARNMLLGDWYDSALVPKSANARAFRYTEDMCPHAEDAARHVINLPTYPALSDDQVTSVITFMNQYGNTGN